MLTSGRFLPSGMSRLSLHSVRTLGGFYRTWFYLCGRHGSLLLPDSGGRRQACAPVAMMSLATSSMVRGSQDRLKARGIRRAKNEILFCSHLRSLILLIAGSPQLILVSKFTLYDNFVTQKICPYNSKIYNLTALLEKQRLPVKRRWSQIDPHHYRLMLPQGRMPRE